MNTRSQRVKELLFEITSKYMEEWPRMTWTAANAMAIDAIVKECDERAAIISTMYRAVTGRGPHWCNKFEYEDALREIEGVMKLLRPIDWIDFKDKVPKIGQKILAAKKDPLGDVDYVRYDGSQYVRYSHWIGFEIPNIPVKKENTLEDFMAGKIADHKENGVAPYFTEELILQWSKEYETKKGKDDNS